MVDKKRILVTRDFPRKGIDRLRENSLFELTEWEQDRPMTGEEQVERAKEHDPTAA
ncbi:MAG: hypothetical protein K9J83_00665 [Desulfarculaceae bacterium]|nr:hypothetical protein [Desulfarculaceae bacterium]